MAIVSIREGYTGHQAGGEVSKKTAVRRFSLVTDSIADDARFIWPQNDPTDTTIIIPAPGTFYPGYNDIRSREPHVKKVSPTFFNVEVRYGKGVDSSGQEGDDEWAANPLSKPAEQTWDTVSNMEPVSEDVNGVPYVNIFNELTSDIERDFADEVLYLNRNEAAFDPWNAFLWRHTVYDGAFRDVPKGRVLMKRIRVEDVIDEDEESNTFGDILYSKVSYEIYFRFRPTILESAYELKLIRQGICGFGSKIINNEANQNYYAWFDRRVHKATGQLDDNGYFVEFKNGEEDAIYVANKQRIAATSEYELPIPDIIFQQRYLFSEWPGVA